MFRRSTTGKQVRDPGVKFCDGCGISTRTERSQRRLDAARTGGDVRGPAEVPSKSTAPP